MYNRNINFIILNIYIISGKKVLFLDMLYLLFNYIVCIRLNYIETNFKHVFEFYLFEYIVIGLSIICGLIMLITFISSTLPYIKFKRPIEDLETDTNTHIDKSSFDDYGYQHLYKQQDFDETVSFDSSDEMSDDSETVSEGEGRTIHPNIFTDATEQHDIDTDDVKTITSVDDS